MSMDGMHITGEGLTPGRDRIIREATHEAAVFGYYDTSEAAQKDGSLTITLLDMAARETLPEGATHRFCVIINQTGYMVTRYDVQISTSTAYRYAVEPDTRIEGHVQEYQLRQAVLDTALWYFTGAESSTYQPGASDEERARVIAELLAEEPVYEVEEDDAVPIDRPVVSELPPDLYLAWVDGEEPPLVQRQWAVSVGWHACQVGLIGKKDGSPELVAVDLSDDLEDEYVLAGLALRDSLNELEQGLPAMLKLPSHLEEAQHTIYGTVLTLLLDRGVPKELADPVREFLSHFHEALEHRQKVETWQYNQYWFAAPVEHAQAHRERLDQQYSGKPPHILNEDDEQDRPLINTVAMGNSEGEALEKLYELRPDLR